MFLNSYWTCQYITEKLDRITHGQRLKIRSRLNGRLSVFKNSYWADQSIKCDTVTGEIVRGRNRIVLELGARWWQGYCPSNCIKPKIGLVTESYRCTDSRVLFLMHVTPDGDVFNQATKAGMQPMESSFADGYATLYIKVSSIVAFANWARNHMQGILTVNGGRR